MWGSVEISGVSRTSLAVTERQKNRKRGRLRKSRVRSVTTRPRGEKASPHTLGDCSVERKVSERNKSGKQVNGMTRFWSASSPVRLEEQIAPLSRVWKQVGARRENEKKKIENARASCEDDAQLQRSAGRCLYSHRLRPGEDSHHLSVFATPTHSYIAKKERDGKERERKECMTVGEAATRFPEEQRDPRRIASTTVSILPV